MRCMPALLLRTRASRRSQRCACRDAEYLETGSGTTEVSRKTVQTACSDPCLIGVPHWTSSRCMPAGPDHSLCGVSSALPSCAGARRCSRRQRRRWLRMAGQLAAAARLAGAAGASCFRTAGPDPGAGGSRLSHDRTLPSSLLLLQNLTFSLIQSATPTCNHSCVCTTRCQSMQAVHGMALGPVSPDTATGAPRWSPGQSLQGGAPTMGGHPRDFWGGDPRGDCGVARGAMAATGAALARSQVLSSKRAIRLDKQQRCNRLRFARVSSLGCFACQHAPSAHPFCCP